MKIAPALGLGYAEPPLPDRWSDPALTETAANHSEADAARRAFEVYRRAANEAALAVGSLMGAPVRCEGFSSTTDAETLVALPRDSYATSLARSGGTAGTLVVAAAPDDAAAVAKRLRGAPPKLPLDARARGAFDEVGNIVASQFLNAVASVLGVSCLPSVPYGHIGDGKALIADISQAHSSSGKIGTVSARLVLEGGAALILVHAPAAGTNADIAARLA